MEDSNLEVRSAVLGGGRRLRFYHELRNAGDDDLGATFIHELDHQASNRRQSTYLATDCHAASTSKPTGSRRRRRSTNSGHATSRRAFPRLVTTEDSMGADVVPSWLANNLIWGGERPDGEQSWIHTTDDGEQIAQATMESRLTIGRLPPVGTRIQSFAANLAVGEKITHDIGWAYDLDTNQVLAVFEGIDLGFSITHRRSAVFRLPCANEN